MIRMLMMLALILMPEAWALAQGEAPWYDALNHCKTITPSGREAAFTAFSSHTPAERHLTESMDIWLEPIASHLPETLKIVRATLGLAYRTLADCRSRSMPIPRLKWLTHKAAFGSGKRWYRAFLHKNSCERPPVSLEALTGWVLRDFAQKAGSSQCTIMAADGPAGMAAILHCGEGMMISADSKPGCEFALEMMRKNLPEDPAFLEQFGWVGSDRR